MAGQIKMTPDQLQAKAKRYGQGSQQITQVLGNLSNLQDELRSEWEGRAFERFDDQFRDLSKRTEAFAELLLEIQHQLEKTAEAVAQQDEALSQNFGLR